MPLGLKVIGMALALAAMLMLAGLTMLRRSLVDVQRLALLTVQVPALKQTMCAVLF